MKYSLEYKVDSIMFVEEEITYHERDKTFILIPDEEKRISSIKIIISIIGPKLYNLRFDSYPDKRQHSLTIDVDKAIRDDLTSEFHYLESMFAFPKAFLRKIYWENPKQEFIPETEEEILKFKDSKVIGAKWEVSYPSDYSILREDYFIELMLNRHKYADLMIPKVFFREGVNELKAFRYINAFYNFYFVIEDLYGEGKAKNEQVEGEFKKSNEFRLFVQWMIDNIKNDDDRKHFNDISVYLKKYRKNFDVDGIIFIIIRVRGQLHHYSKKSTQIQGTPFNHYQFETFAYLMHGIAIRAILEKTVLINT